MQATRHAALLLVVIPASVLNGNAADVPAFKEVKIESLPQGWGYAQKTLTADGKIRGGHLSGGPDAPRVYESEEKCKAADMKLIADLVADVLDAGKKRPDKKEEPPAMDRSRHGYKRLTIICGDGTGLTFVAKFSDEFENAKVQTLHNTIAKYRAGAW